MKNPHNNNIRIKKNPNSNQTNEKNDRERKERNFLGPPQVVGRIRSDDPLSYDGRRNLRVASGQSALEHKIREDQSSEVGYQTQNTPLFARVNDLPV